MVNNRTTLYTAIITTISLLKIIKNEAETLVIGRNEFQPELLRHEYSSCQEQRFIFKGENKLIVQFYLRGRFFPLCLEKANNFYDPHNLPNLDITVRWWKGKLCNDETSHVEGYVDDSCFFGSLKYDVDKEIYMEPMNTNSKEMSERKILTFTKNDLFLNTSSFDKIHNHGKKRDFLSVRTKYSNNEFKTNNKYCSVSVYLHSNFITAQGSKKAAIITTFNSIFHLNNIFEQTKIDNKYGAIIHHITNIHEFTLEEISLFDNLVNADEHLKIFNDILRQRNDTNCQSILVTSYDYQGVLGLAYVGTSSGTGICGINSGILITKANSMAISNSLFNNVLLHEVGHTLGCWHDPGETCDGVNEGCPNGPEDSECSGDLLKGRYIMYPKAKYFGGQNSNKFSKCSLEYMGSIFSEVSRTKCFTSSMSYRCGNLVVEEDEECDPGLSEDACCTSNCKLKPQKQCSPVNTKCCNTDCMIDSKGKQCHEQTVCHGESFCNGISAKCPTPEFFNDYNLCNYSNSICKNGQCVFATCVEFGYTECNSGKIEEYCITTCMIDGACQKLFATNSNKVIYKISGTMCDNNKGICLTNGRCHTSFIATLDLIFSTILSYVDHLISLRAINLQSFFILIILLIPFVLFYILKSTKINNTKNQICTENIKKNNNKLCKNSNTKLLL